METRLLIQSNSSLISELQFWGDMRGINSVGLSASAIWDKIQYSGGISMYISDDLRLNIEVTWSSSDPNSNTVLENYANINASGDAVLAALFAIRAASESTGEAYPSTDSPGLPAFP